MFSRTSRLNKSLLFLEFSGFYILFSFQGSLLFALNSNSFILSQLVVFVNNFFIFFLEAFRNPFRFPLNFRAALSDALYLITTSHPCQALFLKFFKICFSSVFWMKRRKRDLNPRAGCPTYTLSRGASSAS